MLHEQRESERESKRGGVAGVRGLRLPLKRSRTAVPHWEFSVQFVELHKAKTIALALAHVNNMRTHTVYSVIQLRIRSGPPRLKNWVTALTSPPPRCPWLILQQQSTRFAWQKADLAPHSPSHHCHAFSFFELMRHTCLPRPQLHHRLCAKCGLNCSLSWHYAARFVRVCARLHFRLRHFFEAPRHNAPEVRTHKYEKIKT